MRDHTLLVSLTAMAIGVCYKYRTSSCNCDRQQWSRSLFNPSCSLQNNNLGWCPGISSFIRQFGIHFFFSYRHTWALFYFAIMRPRASLVAHDKESACSARELSLIPGSERSPGEGNDNSLHYCCLESSMDRQTWQTTVHGVTESQIWLSN